MSKSKIYYEPNFIEIMNSKASIYPKFDAFRELHNRYWLQQNKDPHSNDQISASHYYVCEYNKQIVGCLGTISYIGNKQICLYLFDLYVIPTFRHKGLARRLVRKSKQLFKSIHKTTTSGLIGIRTENDKLKDFLISEGFIIGDAFCGEPPDNEVEYIWKIENF